jgi:Oxygenase, catalysing oxidative methylation of damaged DNA
MHDRPVSRNDLIAADRVRGGAPCSALTEERFLRSHYAVLVSLGVGENGPGLGASLPDVDPACPERDKTVNLLTAVCRAVGQTRPTPILLRYQAGDWNARHRHDDPQGHGLVFTTRDRPVASARGWSAAPVRHGVSTIRSGRRHTLGLVCHDAA